MAAELGLNVAHYKRAAFLHDIGKALTHEVEGSHAIIGGDLARRYGEHPDVVHAIEAHHNEVEVRTVEAVLTQAADAINSGRPGARGKHRGLRATARALGGDRGCPEGVEKVFIAGRSGGSSHGAPDVVDDIAAGPARDIVKQIEEELTYPGQIKVTVVASPGLPRRRGSHGGWHHGRVQHGILRRRLGTALALCRRRSSRRAANVSV